MMAGCLVLSLGAASYSKPKNRSVVLPEIAAKELSQICSRSGPPHFDGTWLPTEADVRAMESRFSSLSRLMRDNERDWTPDQMSHPEHFYRQYFGLIVGKRKIIYISTLCDKPTKADKWEQHLVVVCDGGGCYWGVVYDTESGKFSDLDTNGIA